MHVGISPLDIVRRSPAALSLSNVSVTIMEDDEHGLAEEKLGIISNIIYKHVGVRINSIKRICVN